MAPIPLAFVRYHNHLLRHSRPCSFIYFSPTSLLPSSSYITIPAALKTLRQNSTLFFLSSSSSNSSSPPLSTSTESPPQTTNTLSATLSTTPSSSSLYHLKFHTTTTTAAATTTTATSTSSSSSSQIVNLPIHLNRSADSLLVDIKNELSLQNTVRLDITTHDQAERFAKSALVTDIMESCLNHGSFNIVSSSPTTGESSIVSEIESLPSSSPVIMKVTLPSLQDALFPLKQQLALVDEEWTVLETKKSVMDAKAESAAKRMVWYGLTAVTAQFGVMFRLTYYEYSWDIMEPIAYFLGSATGIFMYLFYMATQRDFTYETLHGETFSRRRLNLYKKKGYDINRYLELGAQRRSLLAEIDGVIKKYDKK